MAGTTPTLSRGQKRALGGGVFLLLAAFGGHSWSMGFMLSPAFKGAFGDERGDRSADADAVVSVANRLMDYHESLLTDAETCLQTPVDPEARVFVQDTGAFVLLPLLGYDQFISTMCTRICEAQDLLPYAHGGDVQLDDVNLSIVLPDGLMDRILAHIKRFNS